jgi:hypothetical protein
MVYMRLLFFLYHDGETGDERTGTSDLNNPNIRKILILRALR